MCQKNRLRECGKAGEREGVEGKPRWTKVGRRCQTGYQGTRMTGKYNMPILLVPPTGSAGLNVVFPCLLFYLFFALVLRDFQSVFLSFFSIDMPY